MKVQYVADDGKKFDTEVECRNYEDRVSLTEELEKICDEGSLCWVDVITHFDQICSIIRPKKESNNEKGKSK